MAIKALLVALTIPAIVCASHEKVDSIRIVDGMPARLGDIPSIVSLQAPIGHHRCGGSLIDAYTILTAAHCVYGIGTLGYTAKDDQSFGGVTTHVVSMTAHPKFTDGSGSLDHDVGILKLAYPILPTSSIEYAILAAAEYDPAVGMNATVAGWGATEYTEENLPEKLRMAHVPIVSREVCSAQFSQDGVWGPKVTKDMLCAGFNKGDSCHGDSGGPILKAEGKVLIGVVSWGWPECISGHAGVYARVGAMRGFIDRHMGTPDRH
ncbi:hypothetical protein EKO04_007238 [Ascochyta lentis]|uniref:Peptidase S1 domain-containing protein n=1 Tax=Ascochyta lentis TaxID=205686 RepID=A0A8H7MCL4_9PLEO|nr:hypothetical protein EKO04_007238 [Ascochyta lentis]